MLAAMIWSMALSMAPVSETWASPCCSTMAAASQRFFAFELGLNDYVQLKRTFSMTMTIYMIIAIITLFLLETLGLWFLNTQMTIPHSRMQAANWVYQFSIFSFNDSKFLWHYCLIVFSFEHAQ